MSDQPKMAVDTVHPPNTCIITQAGREVARVPVVPVEGRPGEYRYELPPMEMGSHVVELVYVPPEPSAPALTVERGGLADLPRLFEEELRKRL